MQEDYHKPASAGALTKPTKWVALAAFLWFTSAAVATDVIVYTEHYPPYSYVAEDGRVAGLATDLVVQVLDESGLDYELKLVPWNRAYQLATQLDNALVYSLLHTDKRAERFHWLVPVLRSNLYLYGRAGEEQDFSLSALRSGKLRGICIVGDIACQMLRDLGLPAEQLLQAPDTVRAEEKVVRMGRADVFIAQELYAPLNAGRSAAERPFAKFMKLEKPQIFCLAGGHQVKPEILSAVTAAYERLMAKGAYTPLNQMDRRQER